MFPSGAESGRARLTEEEEDDAGGEEHLPALHPTDHLFYKYYKSREAVIAQVRA